MPMSDAERKNMADQKQAAIDAAVERVARALAAVAKSAEALEAAKGAFKEVNAELSAAHLELYDAARGQLTMGY